MNKRQAAANVFREENAARLRGQAATIPAASAPASVAAPQGAETEKRRAFGEQSKVAFGHRVKKELSGVPGGGVVIGGNVQIGDDVQVDEALSFPPEQPVEHAAATPTDFKDAERDFDRQQFDKIAIQQRPAPQAEAFGALAKPLNPVPEPAARKAKIPMLTNTFKTSEELQLEKEPIRVREVGRWFWRRIVVPPNAYVVQTRM